MTVESVLNAEWNKWAQNSRGATPEHQLIVPFMRMLAGPMDFHSGGFRSVRPEDYSPRDIAPMVIGTRCRQLAMFVVYENYLPMVTDYPAAYRKQPSLEFLAQVPTSWDEMRALNAAVGDSITVARRSGKQWYVGSMAAGGARESAIPLKFLGAGKYTAEIWADDRDAPDQPLQLIFRRSEVTAADTIWATLASAGGHVIRLTPAR